MLERRLLGRLRPQRQRVVGQVVVQVDEARHDQGLAYVDLWCPGELGRTRRGPPRDSGDAPVVADPHPPGEVGLFVTVRP